MVHITLKRREPSVTGSKTLVNDRTPEGVGGAASPPAHGGLMQTNRELLQRLLKYRLLVQSHFDDHESGASRSAWCCKERGLERVLKLLHYSL
eukprot:1065486-Pleurochrysis_carterae.AAC.1